MDKETIGIYGWIVIALMCMGAILAFATPLGEYSTDQVYYFITDYTDAAFADPDAVEYLLAKPEVSIEGSELTIKQVAGATSYEIYNGKTHLTTLTDTLTVNLNDYIEYNGIHSLKVTAKCDDGMSETVTVSYRANGLLDHLTEYEYVTYLFTFNDKNGQAIDEGLDITITYGEKLGVFKTNADGITAFDIPLGVKITLTIYDTEGNELQVLLNREAFTKETVKTLENKVFTITSYENINS